MDLNFQKLITSSGAPLWVLDIPTSRTVAAGVLVKAGTRDEIWPQEAGIAHALEHAHFLGTEKLPTFKEIAEGIEEVGGAINAYTAKDMTFYHAQTPSEHAERIVNVLSEQLRKSTFPKGKIPTEMKNIIEEIHRWNDNPITLVWDLNNKFVYNNHSLAKNGLGTEESVTNFTREDLLNFKNRYYGPANYVFIVAGNIRAENALSLFNEYFPEKSDVAQNKRVSENLILRDNRKFIHKKDIEQLNLILSATIGSSQEKDTQFLSLFSDMISGGMSFPLFQEVREKLGLCYTIRANIDKWGEIGLFTVYAGTDQKRYKETIDAVLNVVSTCKSDEKLLEKVKGLKLGKLALQYESTMNIIEIASEDITATGEPKGYDQIVKEIKEIKIEDITKAVDKYLRPELFYTTILAPNNFIE